jgi:hypothetical protein
MIRVSVGMTGMTPGSGVTEHSKIYQIWRQQGINGRATKPEDSKTDSWSTKLFRAATLQYTTSSVDTGIISASFGRALSAQRPNPDVHIHQSAPTRPRTSAD